MKKLLLLLLLAVAVQATGQIIHSHNDYERRAPFTEAYINGAGIIEADVWMRDGQIVVCHDRGEVPSAGTLTDMYIEPLRALGKDAYRVKLMIDLKEEAVMEPLAELLAASSDVFGVGKVEVIISGSRPDPQSYADYAPYIHFDGRFGEVYAPAAAERVWVVSGDIRDFTSWNGKGSIPVAEKRNMQAQIDSLHAVGRKVRFWGTRDNVNTWVILQSMGVDIIGTDHPALCAHFFAEQERKVYTLENPVPVYTPSYESDGRQGRVKNVIFFIGDGMGLSHLTAAETANRGQLTILNLKNIGLQKTYSLDFYNTDSAAAATGLFTGTKTDNGMIAMAPDGTHLENAGEIFSALGRKIGIISTGDITDATPAANYSHVFDRNDSEGVTAQISDYVDLLAGSNPRPFENRADGRNIFRELDARGFEVIRNADSIPHTTTRTVCIDDRFGEYLHTGNVRFLADVTRDAIRKLDSEEGFYMMIESAKIDYAGHANNTPSVVIETLALDLAVAEALKFADRDGQTLVIVTGDHETGGLSLLDGDRERGYIMGHFSSDDHTGLMVPVYAYGVGSQDFRGIYQNTDIIKKIIALCE